METFEIDREEIRGNLPIYTLRLIAEGRLNSKWVQVRMECTYDMRAHLYVKRLRKEVAHLDGERFWLVPPVKGSAKLQFVKAEEDFEKTSR